MPKLPLDVDSLVVSTFETTTATVEESCDALLVDKTVLCRPSQNWTCTL